MTRGLRTVEVRLAGAPGSERVVGRLAQEGKRIYFEHDPAFLRDPLPLSPFKLPPQPGLVEHRDLDFGPIFGVFDDSLPDGWGLRLMDRFFRQRGGPLAEVSVLDRLLYLGTRTMGALTYHPPSTPESADAGALDLDEMARASEGVLHGEATEVPPRLLRAGGSPGGARPKVLVGVGGDDELLSGEAELPPGFAPWIVKLHTRDEPAWTGAIELAYAWMAGEAGIEMPPTRLFATAAGDRFFGVERFDRRGNHRYHVHSFGGLIQSNFRIPSCDYRQLLHVIRVLTRNHAEVCEGFRRLTFNVLAHNRDDHVKNFAFRMTDGGEWELSPAFDLTFAPGPGGEHTMTVDGEGRAPARRHLTRLAVEAGLGERETTAILDAVAAAVERWPETAARAGVERDRRREVMTAIESNLSRL